MINAYLLHFFVAAMAIFNFVTALFCFTQCCWYACAAKSYPSIPTTAFAGAKVATNKGEVSITPT